MPVVRSALRRVVRTDIIRSAAAAAAVVASLLGGAPATAQDLLPAGPVRALDGRLLVSGDVVATAGASDHAAYFNYTDYERNALRMIRVALSGAWRPAERIAFIGEVRSEDFDDVTAYAAYVRVRPWIGRQFDVQAGRIPPAFGAFGRRAYSADNPLIGYPLAYQYLTSLRPDAVPATADDLLNMRARGWQSSYPGGNPAPAPGVPLVTAFRWDTGVQAHWELERFSVTGAMTAGTLSNPRFRDDNGGKQLSARVAARPVIGLIAGVSAARGAWLSRDVVRLLPEGASGRSYPQSALGADVEYSRGHWLVRSEAVWSRWDLPLTATAGRLPLSARAVCVEARYRFRPRLFAAARADDLAFSRITGAIVDGPTGWEAPVRRVEVGGGYYLQRNVVARVAVQHNRRDGGRVRNRTFISAQLAYWF